MQKPFPRQTLLVVLFCLGSALFWQCAPTRNLPALDKQPNCPTSIEGYYEHKSLWRGKTPALIVRKNSEYKIMGGKILAQTEAGVKFDPERESAFYDPQPEFYPFEKIAAFIDEQGRVVKGAIPPVLSERIMLELHLQPRNDAAVKPFKLVLHSGARFGYCIPSDVYSVSAIRFIDKAGNIDLGVEYDSLEIRAQKGRANYVGHLTLGDAPTSASDSLLIPFKVGARPEGLVAAGVLGGAIGGALYGVSLKARGVIGEHWLYISADKKVDSKKNRPAQISLLQRKR